MSESTSCPVCEKLDTSRECPPTGFDENWKLYKCQGCGPYRLSDDALDLLRDISKVERAQVSHFICRKFSNTKVTIMSENVQRALKHEPLPNVFEQAELLIQFVGKHCPYPGEFLRKPTDEIPAKIGAVDGSGVYFILRHLHQNGELEVEGTAGKSEDLTIGDLVKCRLTFKGWEHFDRIQKAKSESRKGFLAYPFSGKGDLNVVEIHKAFEIFQVEISKTGFSLENPLLDKPEMGLLDERLLVEIRNSRFLVADVSTGNQNVYFEAGFALGLDKKVVFTCKNGVKPTFDTNHYQTVFWEKENPQKAAQQLKAVIRNSFPDEAKMTD